MTRLDAEPIRPPTRRRPPQTRRGDERFGFAVAAAAILLGLFVVVERAGMPPAALRGLALLAGTLTLLAVGAMLRTMRVSAFYVAGRAMAPRHAGLSLASLGLALLATLAPPAAGGAGTAGLLAGFMCGLAGAALVSGPLLRKAGASSLAGYVCLRFPAPAVRAAACGLTAVAGLAVAAAGMTSAADDVAAFSGLGRALDVALVAGLAAALLLPGGLPGALWGAAAAIVLPLAILAVSLVVLFAAGRLPDVGDDQWTSALAAMAGPPGGDAAGWGTAFLVPALALGVAATAPFFGPAVASPDRGSAQRAGVIALLWTALAIGLALLAACATAVFVAGGALPAQPALLYSGFARATGAPFVLGGLLPLGFAGMGVALGAAGVHTAAAALGNDLIYPVREGAAMTSRRLAITRMLTLAGVASCAAAAAGGLAPATFASFALSLAAVVAAPLLALTVWPRADGGDALLLIGVGLVALATAAAIEAGRPVSPGVVLLAALAALASGIASSLLRRNASAPGAAFVHAVLHEPDELAPPDKGA